MVKLINIKKSGNVIECDIIPEDSKSTGHLIVDIDKEKIIKCSLPNGYEWCTNHVSHAFDNLLELASKEELPDSWLIMWY